MPAEHVITWPRRAGYRAIQFGCRGLLVSGFAVRFHNRQLLDQLQGALICANHQSFLDPILIGCTFDRRVNFLARQSLFHFPLGQLLRFLDAIPLNRDGLAFSGMKETLRRLRRGEAVLLFPEGTRSSDGRLQPLQPGVCSLARRGRAALLPVGIAGAYDAWPRHRTLPQPAVVDLVVGDPIQRDWFLNKPDEELLAELQRRIADCCEQAEQARRSRLFKA